MTGRVAAALGRREARHLLRHRAVLVGVPLTAWLSVVTQAWSGGWRVDSISVGLTFVPFAWLVLVAANLAALRSSRQGTGELLDSLPAGAPVRTLGLLFALPATLPVTALLMVGWAVHRQLVLDPVGSFPAVDELAVAAIIVVGGGVVGVAVAGWLPHPLFTIPAIFATAFLAGSISSPMAAPSRWLAFWLDPGSLGLAALDPRPTGWHLLWLGAWTVIMGVVALARFAGGPVDRSDVPGRTLAAAGLARPVAIAAAVAVGAAGLAGWAQLKPLPGAEVAHMVSVLEEPARHQECRTDEGLTACFYPELDFAADEWVPVLQRVLAAVPTAARRPLVARQRVATVVGNPDCVGVSALEALHPDVRRRVDPDRVWAADGLVHPPTSSAETLPCGGEDTAWFFTAVQAGSWAVGLPPAPSGLDRRCRADGQARAAVALWLGSQGVERGPETLALVMHNAPFDRDGHIDFGAGGGDLNEGGWTDHPQWGVAWHRYDITAATRLLNMDDGMVSEMIADHWHRLVDPATSTDELLALAGVALPNSVKPVAGPSCAPPKAPAAG